MEQRKATRAPARVPPIEIQMNSFIVDLIVRKGDANRMLIMVSDVTNALQELDSKHELNLFRKQYGNLKMCLSGMKCPIFYLDNSIVVKLNKYEDIKAHSDYLTVEALKTYEQAYAVRKP